MSIEQESAEQSEYTDSKKLESMKIREISKLVSEGKVDIQELMKSLVDSITPIPKKKYVLTKKKPSMTSEERKVYQKKYYQENKEKWKGEYKKDKDLFNENQRKQYRLRKIKKLADSAEPNKVNEN
jgi:hypothetical protein